jgi:sugar phosphate isomerase/epimerase
MILAGSEIVRSLSFSVNHYLCPACTGIETFLDEARNYGFQAVGLTEAALQSLPISDLRAELEARGLGVSSINSAGFFLYEGDAAREQEKRNARLIEQAAALGWGRLNVIVGGSTVLELSEARELAETRLAAFAREAEMAGVQLILEPMHMLNIRTKSCFNSIGQMERLFERIPGLTLNADLFHLWWDPDLERLLRGDSVPVGLFQICDVVIPEGDVIPRRVPLGEGFVPWTDYVRTVAGAFPAIPIELELFADQLPGRRMEEVLASSMAALRTLAEE